MCQDSQINLCIILWDCLIFIYIKGLLEFQSKAVAMVQEEPQGLAKPLEKVKRALRAQPGGATNTWKLAQIVEWGSGDTSSMGQIREWLIKPRQ